MGMTSSVGFSKMEIDAQLGELGLARRLYLIGHRLHCYRLHCYRLQDLDEGEGPHRHRCYRRLLWAEETRLFERADDATRRIARLVRFVCVDFPLFASGLPLDYAQ